MCWCLLPPEAEPEMIEEGGEEEKPLETDVALDPSSSVPKAKDVDWRLAIYWERSTCKEIQKV